jgi:hypothetical protein
MESGKFNTLSRIGKVFYYVGYAAIVVSVLLLLYSIVILGERGQFMLAALPILFYGMLIMAGGLLFQWLPQVSETLTKILNNVQTLNAEVGKLAQPPGGDAPVGESDGGGI